ncbi:MAG: hypothetical protein WA190_08305 [Usitatibacter sp.]
MAAKRKRKSKPPNPKSDKAQSARFLKTAKTLEADEGGQAFERLMDVILPKNRK